MIRPPLHRSKCRQAGGAAMLEALSVLPATLLPHWPALALAAYLLIGLWIGLSEGLKSRRELRRAGIADALAPTVILLTLGWWFLLGAKLVDWLLIYFVARDNRRGEREARDV